MDNKIPNIVIFYSGTGSLLNEIINYNKIHKFVNIIFCLTDNPNTESIKNLSLNNIQLIIFKQKQDQNREDYCNELINLLHPFNIDYIVLSGFMKILTPNIVNKYKIINIHPSLLPNYTGLHTHQRILDNHDINHGFTIHWVDEGLDTGPIIFQGYTELHLKHWYKVGANCLAEYIKQFEKYYYPRVLKSVFTNNKYIDKIKLNYELIT